MNAHIRPVITLSIFQYIDRGTGLEFPNMEFQKDQGEGVYQGSSNSNDPCIKKAAPKPQVEKNV